MDRLIVSRKLDSLRRCLNRVRERCPADVATLAGDPDLQDIVVLNLSRAVQICVDLALHTLSSLRQPVPDTHGTGIRSTGRRRSSPSNQSAGLAKNTSISGSYVSKVDVAGGIIKVWFAGLKANFTISAPSKYMVLSPITTVGSIS